MMPKVLIIEDSMSTSLYMAETLQKVGYHVSTASDGREGLRLALQEHPHCLIIDIVLPGMGGFEICRKVRAISGKVPIILMSVKNTPADRMWGLRQGANLYLPKPFTEDALLQAVHQVLLLPSSATHSAYPKQAQRDAVASSSTSLGKLIPRRNERVDLAQSQRSSALRAMDQRARDLYVIIDGYKNIELLCTMTLMNMTEVLGILRTLVNLHHIQLYQPDGSLVENMSLLFNH